MYLIRKEVTIYLGTTGTLLQHHNCPRKPDKELCNMENEIQISDELLISLEEIPHYKHH